MSSMSLCCGSMPPVKIRSAQSMLSSISSSVFRSRRRSDQVRQQSRNGDQAQRRCWMFGTEHFSGPLEVPKRVCVEPRIDQKCVAGFASRHPIHLPPDPLTATGDLRLKRQSKSIRLAGLWSLLRQPTPLPVKYRQAILRNVYLLSSGAVE